MKSVEAEGCRVHNHPPGGAESQWPSREAVGMIPAGGLSDGFGLLSATRDAQNLTDIPALVRCGAGSRRLITEAVNHKETAELATNRPKRQTT